MYNANYELRWLRSIHFSPAIPLREARITIMYRISLMLYLKTIRNSSRQWLFVIQESHKISKLPQAEHHRTIQ